MGKVRHRKRTRTARLEATATPLAGQDSTSTSSEPSTSTSTKQLAGPQKKEQEITNLLDKLRSNEARERVWATSTLSSLLLSLPPVHLRLLLSRNLIGLLIEKLTLPLPSSNSSSPPSAPNADDLTVAVESLGTLRNLAVSSPPHILSEMHNKRLLLPLLSSHLPLLLTYLPTLLSPAQPPVKPTLPATPADRTACDLTNEANETLRRVYWDWAENVLVLLWCLAESNTKILASLNAQGDKIVQLIMAYLEEERLGIAESAGVTSEEGGMELDGGKKKKQGKKDKEKEKKSLKVPLFVAVAAAQTLHAFVSSNPASNTHLLSAPGSDTFSPVLSSLLSILLTPTAPPSSNPTESSEFWTQLRVLSFGTLLELAKGKSKRKDIEQVREILKEENAKKVLLELVAGQEGRLEKWVKEGGKAASEIDPTAPPAPVPAPNSPQSRLSSLERQAQTLQLALEILSEYLASGLSTPGSGDLTAEGGGEDEEWGGISMDVEEGDLMDEDDDVMVGDEAATVVPDGEDEDGEEDEMDGDEMLEDLANIAGDSSDEDNDEDEDLEATSKLSLTSLPLQLLALTQSTSLSFVPSIAFASTPEGADPSSGLISTSASISSTPSFPAALSALSEALTTIHVRAIEALNNLFVALSKGKKLVRGKGKEKELQTVFEKALEGMHAALSAQEGASVKKVEKKQGAEEEVDEVEEKREELVSASAGVVWGCTRMGLDEGGSLVVGPSTTPFLIQQVYNSAFASAPTPQGEAVRVRVLGALGWIGRRQGVPIEENGQIGQFFLSLLPSAPVKGAPSTPSTSPLTPDALLQVVDSFIDLYADEEREYDVPNFRTGGMLPILETSIGGVRAAIKKIDRKKFPELRLRADGALENLVAFVQYRKDLVKNSRK